MASQPLNAEVSVFRRVRAQTDQDKHDETKDDTVSDAWRYGHPVVRYVRGNSAPTPSGERTKTLQQVYDNVSGLGMPLRLTVERRDIYIEKDSDNVGDDLHENVRDAN